MLDFLLLFSTAAFVLTGAAVGVRLLALAARTRELTDFAVGFSLFDLAGIAYPLLLVGTLDLPLGTLRAIAVASTISMGLGWTGVYLFTQRVFEPGVRWAHVLVALGVGLLAYGMIGGIARILAVPDAAALREPRGPILWFQAAALIVYVWSSTEGFRCWVLARRRLALGLADPLVVNRFLLWGWVGVFSLISIAPGFALSFAGESSIENPIARLATGLAGICSAVVLQLAFLPPAAYRRWVISRAAAAAAASAAA